MSNLTIEGSIEPQILAEKGNFFGIFYFSRIKLTVSINVSIAANQKVAGSFSSEPPTFNHSQSHLNLLACSKFSYYSTNRSFTPNTIAVPESTPNIFRYFLEGLPQFCTLHFDFYSLLFHSLPSEANIFNPHNQR